MSKHKDKKAKSNGKVIPMTIPGATDYNEPDAPEVPKGLAGDVFEIAALVNTTKATFHVKEETALKIVDLAVTILLTTKQMGMTFTPPGAKPLTEEEVAARAAEAAGIENETGDSAPDHPHTQETD